MENQETKLVAGTPVTAGNDRLKGRKPPKLTPEMLIDAWRSALAAKGDPLKKLRSLLRSGLAEEVKAEHISQIVLSMKERPSVPERLALQLATQDRFGKLNSLSRGLLIELRTSWEDAIGYDPQEFIGYRGSLAVETWVTEHALSGPPVDRDSWFRRFVVCIVNNTEPKTLLSGLVAAARRWMTNPGQNSLKPMSEVHSFVRELVRALGTSTIKPAKLGLILTGVDAVDSQFRQVLNRELNLERQIRIHEDQIEALRKQLSSVENDLVESRKESEQRLARTGQLEQSLTEASERYQLLDQHWRGVSEQQLAKQSGSFREKIRHEIQEALLALDRQNPNVEMALIRIRRVREILES